ncbi:STM3941 family protein [Dyella sp.]|jgi:hypothetical protein|uniref:STM3941 family protein n=1 Tax=Dyella sp. TaxID=1869338 RepID=UPI002FD8E13D
MSPIVINASRLKYALLLLVAVGFVFAGAFMVAFDAATEAWLGWANIVLFGACIPLFLWQLLDARPRLVMDEQGIFDRTLGVGVIPWSEITGAYLRSIMSVDFICLELRDPLQWLQRLSPAKRAVVRANEAMGFSALNVSLGGLEADAQQVHELILKMVASGEFVEDRGPGADLPA